MSKEDSPRAAYAIFMRPDEAELFAQQLEAAAQSIRFRTKFLQSKFKKLYNPETHQTADEPCCTHQNTATPPRGQLCVNIPQKFIAQYVNYLIAKHFRFEIIPSDRDSAVCFRLIEEDDTDSQVLPFLKAYYSFCYEVQS